MNPTTSREAKLRTATGILAALTAVGILLIALAPLAIPILALTALFLAPIALLPIVALPLVLLVHIAVRLRRGSRDRRREREIRPAETKDRSTTAPIAGRPVPH